MNEEEEQEEQEEKEEEEDKEEVERVISGNLKNYFNRVIVFKRLLNFLLYILFFVFGVLVARLFK